MKEKEPILSVPSSAQIQAELDERKQKKKYKTILRNTVFVVLVVAAVMVLISSLWLPVMKIYGSSMQPTLTAGELVAAVKTKRIDRGDIVAFYYGNKLLIKRCIAVGGDTVSIDDSGNVSVNGKRVDEPYIKEAARGECDMDLPCKVPQGRYFLMGDNRADSIDSRSKAIGCVKSDDIVGKLIFCFWPLSHFKLIN